MYWRSVSPPQAEHVVPKRCRSSLDEAHEELHAVNDCREKGDWDAPPLSFHVSDQRCASARPIVPICGRDRQAGRSGPSPAVWLTHDDSARDEEGPGPAKGPTAACFHSRPLLLWLRYLPTTCASIKPSLAISHKKCEICFSQSCFKRLHLPCGCV